MIGDWSRRYFVALQTREGREKIARGYLIVAVLINLIAMLLPPLPNGTRVATFLLGIGTGVLLVSIVNYFLNRRAE
jgi:phosphatidylglycerophosphate synthase